MLMSYKNVYNACALSTAVSVEIAEHMHRNKLR